MGNKNLLNNNIVIRALTTLCLAPLIIYFIYSGGMIFYALIILIAGIMAVEWHGMMLDKKSYKWILFGFIYISTPCMSLIYLRNDPNGFIIVMWLIATIWITDIAAFFSGKLIGGPKFAPSISPKKTWAGFFGGLALALLFGFYASYFIDFIPSTKLIFITPSIALAAIFGDLFESWIKRKLKVKDSGSIIPGHGGILDRIDSFVIAAPVAIIFIKFCIKNETY